MVSEFEAHVCSHDLTSATAPRRRRPSGLWSVGLPSLPSQSRAAFGREGLSMPTLILGAVALVIWAGASFGLIAAILTICTLGAVFSVYRPAHAPTP